MRTFELVGAYFCFYGSFILVVSLGLALLAGLMEFNPMLVVRGAIVTPIAAIYGLRTLKRLKRGIDHGS